MIFLLERYVKDNHISMKWAEKFQKDIEEVKEKIDLQIIDFRMPVFHKIWLLQQKKKISIETAEMYRETTMSCKEVKEIETLEKELLALNK